MEKAEEAGTAGDAYKKAGVDIEAGYEVVRRIRTHCRSTYRPEVLKDIGTFGGLFRFLGFKKPVLVAGTDGVGTKLKIAFMADKHDTVGIDLVAYSVNDIICHGACPLFFLDYFASGAIEPAKVESVVAGIAAGCRQAGCALIGGETAELPGLYAPGEYDLAGFAVGAVEEAELLDGSKTAPGDVIIGVRSTGLQSNGYSLVRRVVFESAGLSVDSYIDELGRTVGEELLEPTGIYSAMVQNLLDRVEVKGLANITGGGLVENVPRTLADGLDACIRKGSWQPHPVFGWLQDLGDIPEPDMYTTFNMGVGFVVIVAAAEVAQAVKTIQDSGWEAYEIGEVRRGSGRVVWV